VKGTLYCLRGKYYIFGVEINGPGGVGGCLRPHRAVLCVVSADESSVICVWNADTGERVVQFVARMRVLPDGTELPVAVTAMRFDGSLRRLVTGFSDGCVRTFNFNNGAVLREVT